VHYGNLLVCHIYAYVIQFTLTFKFGNLREFYKSINSLIQKNTVISLIPTILPTIQWYVSGMKIQVKGRSG
jgi:hypothetical protein